MLTWVPAIIVSYLTGGQDLNKFNIRLLSPCIQKLLPMRYRRVELIPTERKISIINGIKHEPSELVELNNKTHAKH